MISFHLDFKKRNKAIKDDYRIQMKTYHCSNKLGRGWNEGMMKKFILLNIELFYRTKN